MPYPEVRVGVERLTRRSRRGWEAHPEFWEES